jgi:hypothetical protein
MVEGETPSQYALRIAEAGLRNQRLQFPQTYGVDPEIQLRVTQALQSGEDPAKVREDFLSAYRGADPSFYGL